MPSGARNFIVSGKFPGAFIVDAILAFIPALEAHRFGWPFWAQLILYWSTVWILRRLDGRAMRSGWRIWWRGGVKIPVILGTELIASLGAIETCNPDLTVCHRLLF
jgi:hypothetical protein